MNTGIFGEGFPYSNFHDLNMDWIIKIAKDFLDQYTHIQDIIEQGKTDIQDLTSSGLDQLQEKADALEELLQEWYNEHSEDIADELADALADLNSWYNTHSQDIADDLASALRDLNTALQTAITNFNTSADTKAQETIASIPDDYTELANKVTNLESTLQETWYIGTGNLKLGRTAGNVENGTRAISDPFYVNDNIIVVNVTTLPSNIKYEIEYYDSTDFSSFTGNSGGFVTTTGSTTLEDTGKYARVQIGTIDNTDISQSALSTLLMTLTVKLVGADDKLCRNSLETGYRTNYVQNNVNYRRTAGGAESGSRAISNPIYLGRYGCTLQVINLPSNVQYEIDYYHAEDIESFYANTAKAKGWLTTVSTFSLWENDFQYIRVLFRMSDNSDVTPAKLSGLNIVATSTVRMMEDEYARTPIEYKTRQLQVLNNHRLNTFTTGLFNPGRMVSSLVRINGEVATIKVNTLPSNIKFEVGWYNSEELSSFVRNAGTGWLTSEGTYSFDKLSQNYVGMTFATRDGTEVTESEISTMDIVIEDSAVIAKDYTMRNAYESRNKKLIKVCSYNVGTYQYGNGSPSPANCIQRIRNFLSKNKFDILATQEDTTYAGDHVAVEDNAYSYIYQNFIKNISGIGTTIRTDFNVLKSSEMGDNPRYWTYGTMNINGKEILVMSVHFTPYDDYWSTDFDNLVSFLNNYDSFIILGDFNYANEDYSDESAQQLIDLFTNEGYKVANGGYLGLMKTHRSQSGNPPEEQALDNIITSPDIIIKNTYTLEDDYDNLFSDHYPLVAELLI